MKRVNYMLVLMITFAFLLIGCSQNDTSSSTKEHNQSAEGKSSVQQEKSGKTNESSNMKASINGKAISQEELDYECFRTQLNQALTDPSMETSCPSEGTMIAQIVELYAVDYIAEEQGVSVTESEVSERVSQIKNELASSPAIHEMLQSFGEEKFWQKEQKRYYTIIKTEKIKDSLIAQEKEKYANYGDNVYNEETYKMNAEKELEDLITEAVGLIDVKIKAS